MPDQESIAVIETNDFKFQISLDRIYFMVRKGGGGGN